MPLYYQRHRHPTAASAIPRHADTDNSNNKDVDDDDVSPSSLWQLVACSYNPNDSIPNDMNVDDASTGAPSSSSLHQTSPTAATPITSSTTRHLPRWLHVLIHHPSLQSSSHSLIHQHHQHCNHYLCHSRATQPHSSSTSSPSVPTSSHSTSSSSLIDPLVYVHQREIALVKSRQGSVVWLGSGDATTCVILLIRCNYTGRCICTHIDGASRQQIFGGRWKKGKIKRDKDSKSDIDTDDNRRCQSILDALNQLTDEDCKHGLDVHLVGGFQTDVAQPYDQPAMKEWEEEERMEEEVEAEWKKGKFQQWIQKHIRIEHLMATSTNDANDDSDDDGGAHDSSDVSDMHDGLVQTRDILLLLHAYSSRHPELNGSREIEMRLRTLCVGPNNTQWKEEEEKSETDKSSSSSTTTSSSSSTSDVLAHPCPSTFSPSSVPLLHYPRPYLTSLFIHLPSGSLHPYLPYQRCDRGPCMELRVWRGMNGSKDEQGLAQVYQEDDDEFIIKAVKYPSYSPSNLSSFLSLPDSVFIQRCSTSPLVEPPSFIPDMRDAFSFIIQHNRWQALFKKGANERWKYQRSTLTHPSSRDARTKDHGGEANKDNQPAPCNTWVRVG